MGKWSDMTVSPMFLGAFSFSTCTGSYQLQKPFLELGNQSLGPLVGISIEGK